MKAQAPLSILLVDDQVLVRSGIVSMIQQALPDAEIRVAGKFDEAVSALQGGHFDVAFLDYDLREEKTGFDLLKQIRAHDMEVRVIMLSGEDDKAIVMECLQEGASGYILKDMDSTGLFENAINTVFAGGIFLPAKALGRGGFSPNEAARKTAVTPESMGINGRLLETLYWVCQGLPNKLIARNMGIEEGTVRKDYMDRLFRKLGVRRRTELMVEVARLGMVIPAPERP